VIAYAQSIGLEGLENTSDLTTLRESVIAYQAELIGE